MITLQMFKSQMEKIRQGHRGREVTDLEGQEVTDHRGREAIDRRGRKVTDHRDLGVTDQEVTGHRDQEAAMDHANKDQAETTNPANNNLTNRQVHK